MTAATAFVASGVAPGALPASWGGRTSTRFQAADDLDFDLAVRAGRGDPAAAQALVARKLPRILALAGRMLGDPAEAEDVAQEAMLRAWRHAPGWRPGKARFDTWLHRVALNLC